MAAERLALAFGVAVGERVDGAAAGRQFEDFRSALEDMRLK